LAVKVCGVFIVLHVPSNLCVLFILTFNNFAIAT